METSTPIPPPQEIVPVLPARNAVIAGTHGALETLSMVLVPAATIAVMAYGFKMMFRGVLH
ncbi:MAG: hypothetical protein PHX87_04555 [Candidatus Peribacteraceae bacterium]|nr:hypothetical protein [Candidatus Peribacteraceae bacterium]MDD5742669.1 hypothetical protein [Candidatus Peribacteraceae bacterium]